jgi:hypothetical protein
MELMHTFVLCIDILFPCLLATGDVWAVHKPIATVLVDMRLDMAPRNDLFASFSLEWAFDLYFIAHVD